MIIYLISSAAVLFSIAYFVLIRWLLHQWKQIDHWITATPTPPKTSVTILVPARNEAHNIRHCLDSLLQQSYPSKLLEIIVIDDHSTDATPDLVRTYQHQGVRLLILADILTQPTQSYKKAAITAGIAAAKGTLIVTTDADCLAPHLWIHHIVQSYQAQDWQCIAGPVLFHEEENALEEFQSLDFMGTMIITGAGIYSGQLLMANGANFAYTKAAFEAVGGFSGVVKKASGDDLFLLHKIAQRYPGRIGFLKQIEATIRTKAMPDLRSFAQQRIRWGTKNASYNDYQVTLVAGLVFATCWGIILTFLLSLTGSFYGILGCLLALGIKALADYRLLREATAFFDRRDLRSAFGWAQLGHILYIALLGMASLLVRRYEWKGRRVE